LTAELHCHSVFSVDGHDTPEEIVEIVAASGYDTLSITDHNHLGSQQRAVEHAKRRSLRYIPGVEIDAGWKGHNHHFLAFGIDWHNPALKRLVDSNTAVYSHYFEVYLRVIESRNLGISRECMLKRLPERYPTHPSPVLNIWFARGVLIEKGVLADMSEFPAFWQDIAAEVEANGEANTLLSFGTYEETRDAVHEAGGLILLAHVAHYYRGDLVRQLEVINELLQEGCDGFELYHPYNVAESHFNELIREAKRLGCAVSGGSDCHHVAQGPSVLASCSAPNWVENCLLQKLSER